MAKGGSRAFKIKHQKKKAFLEAYKNTGNVSVAARASGIERYRFYNWLESDPEFLKASRDAEEAATERMEAEAVRRAVQGTEKGIYHQGVKVDIVKEYSDLLLIFLMKARAPQKYRENMKIEASGPNGGPIEVMPVFNVDGLSIEERRRFRYLLDKARGVGGADEVPRQIAG